MVVVDSRFLNSVFISVYVSSCIYIIVYRRLCVFLEVRDIDVGKRGFKSKIYVGRVEFFSFCDFVCYF